MIPGVTMRPLASITWAFEGMLTFLPTAVIFPSSTRTCRFDDPRRDGLDLCSADGHGLFLCDQRHSYQDESDSESDQMSLRFHHGSSSFLAVPFT